VSSNVFLRKLSAQRTCSATPSQNGIRFFAAALRGVRAESPGSRFGIGPVTGETSWFCHCTNPDGKPVREFVGYREKNYKGDGHPLARDRADRKLSLRRTAQRADAICSQEAVE
jgi:hypothetical protein